jgi:tetratricopeptide (TPR) repeat protein
MSRLLRISWLLFGCWLASGTARAEEQAGVGQTVYLTVREPQGVDPKNQPGPLLARELIRQAFLLAARDELGLATRDVILREDFPEKPDEKSAPFELSYRVSRAKRDFDVEYVLKRPRESQDMELWRWVINYNIDDPKSLETLETKGEEFSRGALKEVLTQAGWGRPVPAARAAADVPAATLDLIGAWNEISVLAGLRQVHAEIREKGEAPELLAALVVGYANLGAVAKHHYSAGFKVYYARALLYAERLVRKTTGAPWALCHRAYARMVLGLHNFAANDIATAKKALTASPSKPLPVWTDVLEAFGQGDLPRMLKLAKTPGERRLACDLNLEAVVYGPLNELKIKAAHAFQKECPECLRIYEILAFSGELGAKREGAFNGLSVANVLFREKLLRVPGLPEKIVEQIHGAGTGLDAGTEVEFRTHLIEDLKSAGAPERDRGEPSLSAVGHALEEIDFAVAMRMVQFLVFGLSVPVDEPIASYAPLCAAHPYGAYLQAFTNDKSRMVPAAATLLKNFQLSAATYRERSMLQWLYGMTPTQQLHEWFNIPTLHADDVFSDEMLGILNGSAGEPDARAYNRAWMRKAWNTSNRLPLSVAMRVSRDWDHARMETDVTERDYADDPLVMNALADRYYRQKKYDDSERCAKRLVEIDPAFSTYRLLANIYQVKQDRAQWRATLERALTLPANGLEHAQIRNEIALDLLDHLEFKEAAAFADAAAESYSAWSMLTAARCHEMLGDWKKSEELVRAVSERYTGHFYEWMLWCHRTGHGDVRAADEFVRDKIEAWGIAALFSGQYRYIGFYYLLTGAPEKASVLFEKTFEQTHDLYAAAYAALIADEFGKAKERDKYFQQILDFKLPKDVREAPGGDDYQKLVLQLQKMLPPQNAGQLDSQAIDKILSSRGIDRAVLEYFIGVFLKNRGNLEGAKKYLTRCAQSKNWQLVEPALASQLLRELKVKVPPTP